MPTTPIYFQVEKGKKPLPIKKFPSFLKPSKGQELTSLILEKGANCFCALARYSSHGDFTVTRFNFPWTKTCLNKVLLTFNSHSNSGAVFVSTNCFENFSLKSKNSKSASRFITREVATWNKSSLAELVQVIGDQRPTSVLTDILITSEDNSLNAKLTFEDEVGEGETRYARFRIPKMEPLMTKAMKAMTAHTEPGIIRINLKCVDTFKLSKFEATKASDGDDIPF